MIDNLLVSSTRTVVTSPLEMICTAAAVAVVAICAAWILVVYVKQGGKL